MLSPVHPDSPFARCSHLHTRLRPIFRLLFFLWAALFCILLCPYAAKASTPISSGQTLSGSLTTTDGYWTPRGSSYYADIYSFTGTAGQTVVITMTPSSFYGYLGLNLPDGSNVTAYGTGSNYSASITYLITKSMTYTVAASSRDQNVTGAYTISLQTRIDPQTPTALKAIGLNTQNKLTWTAPPGTGTYKVKRSLTAGGPYTTVATGITDTIYFDTGLTNGTPYYYVVSFVNAAGEGGNSNEVSAKPLPLLFGDNFSTSAQSNDINFEYNLNVNNGGRQSGSLAPLVWSGPSPGNYCQVNNASAGAANALLLAPIPRTWYTITVNPNHDFSEYNVLDINVDLLPAAPQSPNPTTQCYDVVQFDAGPGTTHGMYFTFYPTGRYSVSDFMSSLPDGSFATHTTSPYHLHFHINALAFDGFSPVIFSMDVDGIHKFDYVMYEGMAHNYITLQATVVGGNTGDHASYHIFDNFTVGAATP